MHLNDSCVFLMLCPAVSWTIWQGMCRLSISGSGSKYTYLGVLPWNSVFAECGGRGGLERMGSTASAVNKAATALLQLKRSLLPFPPTPYAFSCWCVVKP